MTITKLKLKVFKSKWIVSSLIGIKRNDTYPQFSDHYFTETIQLDHQTT